MRNDYPHEDDWMEEAPRLASLRESMSQGEVPEGYFAELPGKMMARIHALDGDPAPEAIRDADVVLPRPTPGQSNWQLWGVAASVVLLLGLGLIFFLPERELPAGEAIEQRIQVQLTSVSATEIVNEIDIAEVSEDELYAMLGQEAQAALENEMGGMGQQEMLDFLDELELDPADLEGLEFDDAIFNDTNL
ncbi:MAG: hypothetical protein AAF998_23885 [Bacteroidota bacterium]